MAHLLKALSRRTLLVVPLSFHLLDELQVGDGVPGVGRRAEAGQEVSDDDLVLRLARGGKAGQVLEDQLLPVSRESLLKN